MPAKHRRRANARSRPRGVPIEQPVEKGGKMSEVTYDSFTVDECRRSAVLGDAGAMTELGRRLFRGDGVAASYEYAVRWFRRAAERGHGMGRVFLGMCYRHGTGVPVDHAEAERWFRWACANAPDPTDATRLAGVFLVGAYRRSGWRTCETTEEVARVASQAIDRSWTRPVRANDPPNPIAH
jgi:TPR repeat protein